MNNTNKHIKAENDSEIMPANKLSPSSSHLRVSSEIESDQCKTGIEAISGHIPSHSMDNDFTIKLEPIDDDETEMESGPDRALQQQPETKSSYSSLSFPPVQMLKGDQDRNRRKNRSVSNRTNVRSRKTRARHKNSSSKCAGSGKIKTENMELVDGEECGVYDRLNRPNDSGVCPSLLSVDSACDKTEAIWTEKHTRDSQADEEKTKLRPVALFSNLATSHDSHQQSDEKTRFCSKSDASQLSEGERYGKRTRTAPKGRTQERPHLCELCQAAFTQAVYLKRHLRTHSDVKPWRCEQCGKSFIRRSQLQVHERSHSGEKPYKCSVCDASFSQSGHLQVHVRSHTGEKPFQCDQCDSAFTSSSHLNTHIRSVHTDIRPFECLVCGMAFNTPANLRLHCRTHSGEKPYKCDQCDAAFSQSGNLKQHKARHSWTRPHACQFCGMRFSRTSILYKHFRTHERDKVSFTCSVCNETFDKSALLRAHIKKDHGKPKVHRCKVCQSTFTQSCNLKRHLLTHSGEKPFACSECDSAFTQLSHLQRHIRRIHSDAAPELRPHKCADCPASFMRMSDLKRHGRFHVKGFMSPQEQTQGTSSGSEALSQGEEQGLSPASASSTSSDTAHAKKQEDSIEDKSSPESEAEIEAEETETVELVETKRAEVGNTDKPCEDTLSESSMMIDKSGSVTGIKHEFHNWDFDTAESSSDFSRAHGVGEVVFPNMSYLHRYSNN